MSLPHIKFLHLTVSDIQQGQTFSCCPPAHSDPMGENNTPTALKGCGVKIRDEVCTLFALTPYFIHLMCSGQLFKWSIYHRPYGKHIYTINSTTPTHHISDGSVFIHFDILLYHPVQIRHPFTHFLLTYAVTGGFTRCVLDVMSLVQDNDLLLQVNLQLITSQR